MVEEKFDENETSPEDETNQEKEGEKEPISKVTAESEVINASPETEPEAKGTPSAEGNFVVTNPGRKVGGLIILFVAILLVLIGGMASYYYYTFLGSGSAEFKQIRKVWQEAVIVGNELNRAFGEVNEISDLASLVDPAVSANRTLRDLTFDLPESVIGSKELVLRSGLAKTLDAFIDFVGEVKFVAQRGEEVEKVDEVETLLDKNKALEDAYDELLLLAGRRLAASLPRDLFDFAPKVEDLVKDYVANKEQKESEEEKAIREAAEAVATAFMQAYKERDPDGMIARLTPGAQNEFNPAILQESSDLVSFRILETEVINENKVEISGREQWQTPDGQTVAKERLFRLIKVGEKWKIDVWDEVQ